MDRALSHPEKREPIQQKNHHQLQPKLCLPALKLRNLKIPNPFSVLALWVSKSLIRVCHGGEVSNGSCLRRLRFEGMVVNNSAYCASPCSIGAKMEGPVEKTEGLEEREEGICINGGNVEGFVNVVEVGWKESSSSSEFLVLEETLHERHSHSTSDDSSSPPSVGWPVHKSDIRHCANTEISEGVDILHFDDRKLEKQGSSLSEIEMMKERFSKLLLGEDMSGCGNGVCTALAIANAVTNLCATIFGQIWRLEPVPPEKKSMWRREMEWLLCVSDHIVELIPSWQTFLDGSKLEVMTSRPRSDLFINLPALRKLDNMLLEILDSFVDTDFWYVDQGILDPDADGSASFRRPLPHQEEKWWLPVPRVPPGGLGENSRKQLQSKRDCTNQILKAAMAINSVTLADMEVPESYFDSLPKNGRASLGDLIHRYITSEQFSPECLLDCLNLSSEHQALKIANRVEASIYIWRRRINSKPINSANRSNSRSSWEMVKELVIDLDKRELLLADRAESLLLCLKQRFPGLPQTTLDMTKIQYNKDVGKSILESYSRVLESLAFNIVARIDDLVYVDDLTKHSDQLMMSISKEVKGVGIPYTVPISSTPYKTAFTTPSFSPTGLPTPSPAKGEQYSTLFDSSKIPPRGVGVKKVLTDYLNTKGRDCNSEFERSDSSSQSGVESFECSKKAISLSIQDSL